MQLIMYIKIDVNNYMSSAKKSYYMQSGRKDVVAYEKYQYCLER